MKPITLLIVPIIMLGAPAFADDDLATMVHGHFAQDNSGQEAVVLPYVAPGALEPDAPGQQLVDIVREHFAESGDSWHDHFNLGPGTRYSSSDVSDIAKVAILHFEESD